MSRPNFEEDVKRALLLIREFRLHCKAQRLDPRAVRLAIKFLLLADSQFALKALSPEEEAQLDNLAHQLLEQSKKNEGLR